VFTRFKRILETVKMILCPVFMFMHVTGVLRFVKLDIFDSSHLFVFVGRIAECLLNFRSV